MLYRILTEEINRRDIEAIVSARFPGYTIIAAIGYWKATREFSLIIEIVGELTDWPAVKDVALNIKRINTQQAVMVQTLDIESVLL